MSVIQSLLQRFWPQKKSHNIFVGGLDSSGKTSIIYKLLLDETITTIPTIGLNIETISVPASTKRAIASKSHSATLWDIGGCGQINPLRRLYLSNSEHTDAVLWVVDAADHSRKQDAISELKTFLRELGEFVRDKPFLVLAHKSDIPNAQSAVEVTMLLKDVLAGRLWSVSPSTVNAPISCTGFPEAFDWLDIAIGISKHKGTNSRDAHDHGVKLSNDSPQQSHLQSTLERCLAQVMDGPPPEVLLEQFNTYTLPSWDHCTHIRIAYTILGLYGRQKGKNMIFDGIEKYISHSQQSTGRSFHVTMTYFWVQVVHFAMRSAQVTPGNAEKFTQPASGGELSDAKVPKATSSISSVPATVDSAMPRYAEEFARFLLLNPYVVDGTLWQDYYSKEVIMSPEAKRQMVLPDRKPLPSFIERDEIRTGI